MLGYWTRLATTGNPDSADAPAWPADSVAQDPYLELKNPPSAAARTALCDFWDAL